MDDRGAEAFLEALSPVEIDLYEKAMAAREEMADAAEHAGRQQFQRLHYQAELARRRFERADPDNRLVAAELERGWEGALRELRRAEETRAVELHKDGSAPSAGSSRQLLEEDNFKSIGRRLPEIWTGNFLPTSSARLYCAAWSRGLSSVGSPPTRSRRASCGRVG